MYARNSQPSTVAIRQFLTESFSDEELATLCFDYFRDVYDDFASGMTKGQKIQLVLERCERRDVLPNLLAAIQRARPEQYQERFPQIAAQPEPLRQERDPRQVFISHAHQDANFAHRLAKDLQKHGWHVWIAPDSIRPGEKWGEAIDRGLGESGIFVAALSPAAVQSRWVKNETYVAIELESKGCIRFVPLDVERCDVPGLWNVYQRVSFLGSYADGLKALLADLEQTGQLPAEKPAALPEPPPAAGAADAFGKTDQQISGPAKVQTTQGRAPSQGSAVLSTFLLRAKRNPLPLLLGGAGIVAVVLVVVVISSVKSPVTLPPTPRPAETTSAAVQASESTKIPAPTSPPRTSAMDTPVVVPTAAPTETPLPTVPVTPGKATATPSLGSSRFSQKDGMTMVYVPSGEFLMGSADSDARASNDEKPQHRVYLDAFWVDKTEVTNAQYKKCVGAGACEASDTATDPTRNSDTQPVVDVNSSMAQTYCQSAGRQLPTEAQWEKAARGTDGRVYPWGNQPATCEYAVMNDGSGNGCGKGDPAWSVGSKPKGASPYGALDMAGNVSEWVSDWYSDTYYAGSPSKNPPGPPSGEHQVMRGGFVSSDTRYVRGASRHWNLPGNWSPDLGFRCVCASGSSSGC